MVTLSTTSSIVDYLASQKKPTDFTSRTSLYNSLGLGDRLGKYVGSSTQNTAFLKALQTPTQTGEILKTNPVNTASPLTAGSLNLSAPAGIDWSKLSMSAPSLKFSTPTTATSAVATAGAPTPQPIITPTPQDINANAPQTPTQTPRSLFDAGISAEQAAASIPKAPSADEILNNVLNSNGFQNFQQQQELTKTLATGDAESEKARLEATAQANTKQFIDSMGKRGLFFSGETPTGLQALAESLASSKLNVDRKLAGELLQSDFKTRDEIIKEVSDIAKKAQDGRKDAIAALEKVGLTVVGDQIVPTLAARSAQRADEAAIRAEENQQIAVQREARLAQTAEFNQQATLARIQLSEEAAARAATSLQLSLDRAVGNGAVTSGSLKLDNKALGDAAKMLNETRDSSGWADAKQYESLFYDWINKGGLPQDFTKAFPPNTYVNPTNSAILPILQNTSNKTLGPLF